MTQYCRCYANALDYNGECGEIVGTRYDGEDDLYEVHLAGAEDGDNLILAEDEFERLREAQRWIPVDEKSDDLPHDDGGQREVMCYFADGVMEIFNIYSIRAWNERRRKIGANDLITHFMPLPAAPKGENT